ncbi:MAG TPA: response regulator [Methylophilaceae bacterium]|nr:response regulator [Methylophilaceae bacterium]
MATILIVDDSSFTQDFLGQVVGSLGHDAVACAASCDALKRVIMDRRPMLAIIDENAMDSVKEAFCWALADLELEIPLALLSVDADSVRGGGVDYSGLFQIVQATLAAFLEDCESGNDGSECSSSGTN